MIKNKRLGARVKVLYKCIIYIIYYVLLKKLLEVKNIPLYYFCMKNLFKVYPISRIIGDIFSVYQIVKLLSKS